MADQVRIKITADTSQLGPALSSAKNAVVRESASMGYAMAGAVAGAVATLANVAINVMGSAVGAVSESVHAFRDENKVFESLAQSIQSTGMAAGWSADQIKKLAESRSSITGIDPTQVMQSASVLTSFENVQGDEFVRTLQVAEDMAARLGSNMQSEMLRVARSLENPIQGLSALNQVGINFTETERKVIEGLYQTGEIVQAQVLILNRLEESFGGASRASTDAYTRMMRNWYNAKKELAGVLYEAVEPLANKLFETASSMMRYYGPMLKDLAAAFSETFNAILDYFGLSGKSIIDIWANVDSFITTSLQQLGTGFAHMSYTIGQWAVGLLEKLGLTNEGLSTWADEMSRRQEQLANPTFTEQWAKNYEDALTRIKAVQMKELEFTETAVEGVERKVYGRDPESARGAGGKGSGGMDALVSLEQAFLDFFKTPRNKTDSILEEQNSILESISENTKTMADRPDSFKVDFKEAMVDLGRPKALSPANDPWDYDEPTGIGPVKPLGKPVEVSDRDNTSATKDNTQAVNNLSNSLDRILRNESGLGYQSTQSVTFQ